MDGPPIAKSERDEVLRLFLDQATEHALIVLDRGGIIVQWLAGAQTVFGYSADEVIGRRHSRLFTPEDVEAGAPEKELAIADTGTPAEDDRWMLRKDGLRFWATGILQAIRAADGAVIGYGKVLRNRTDLKGQLESLENEVRKLNRADERKNRFISTLSHELRNPLSSLVTAVELLDIASSDPEDDANFALAIIRRQVDAMRRLVDDLLDITRVSAGKVKLELREKSLVEIVKAAADACRPLLTERTHNFHLILGEQPVIVRADAVRLEQVFVNLIQNAAKYTEYSGTIWVKLIVEGQEAVVKVEDTGIGISADLLPQIFDLFTQAEFAAGAATEGLGIGLSVVRDIVQLHGGTVTVRSDGVGKGSEFSVRLPLAGPDNLRPDSPTSVH
jgi:PAS domain S-box-containing protein